MKMFERISGAQGSLIAAIRSGTVVRYSFGIDARVYIEWPGFPACTPTALSLERRGVIERFDETHTGCKFRLTAAAEAYFAKQIGQPT